MRTVSLTASHARETAYAAERLQVQRQATAAARAHTNALQIKVVVALGCTLSAVLGYALHRTSISVANVDRTSLVTRSTGVLPDAHIAQVQVPFEGDTCRRFHFDNRSGTVTGESFSSCAGAELSQVTRGPSPTRTEAIMSAFRVAR